MNTSSSWPRWRRALLVWLCALVTGLLAPQALAEGPSDADKATARKLMDDGDRLVADGKLEAALAAYRGADAIMKVPTTGLELGRTQIALGRLIEASTTLLRVARHPAGTGEPRAYTTARAEARELAATIGPRLASVTLQPSGLPHRLVPQVKIDGQALPAAAVALPRQLNPGEHHLLAEAEGYLSIERQLTLTEGQQSTVALAFEPDPNATAASVEPQAPPAGPVAGAATPPAHGAAAGRGDGGDRRASGQRGGISALTWVALGVGAAGLVVGGVTGVVALGDSSTLHDECAADAAPGDTVCDAAQQADLDGAMTIAHVSTVGFAVGGAGLAVGLISLVVDLSAGGERTEMARLLAVVGPGTLAVVGRF